MSKKIPDHLRDKARKCVFCDEPGVTQTHIFPDWLNELIRTPGVRENYYSETADPLKTTITHEKRRKQGTVFSQKPYLACGECNNGWMNRFEDEMQKFSKPIFTGTAPVALNKYQTRVLVGWLTLITMLAQYIDFKLKDRYPISAEERAYFKRNLEPPENWTIVASSLNGEKWRQAYRMHVHGIHFNPPDMAGPLLVPGWSNNTQIASFGFGHLFAQVFSCPGIQFVWDFRTAAKATGLIQLWPIPTRIWPLPQRFAKFPTKLVLDDEGADEIADSFHKRFRMLTYRR